MSKLNLNFNLCEKKRGKVKSIYCKISIDSLNSNQLIVI
jgi:hypothetical protein